MSKLHATFLRVLTVGAAFALVVAVLGLGAAAAPAAPSEPTLNLTQLQALLDASPSGTVDGYFKTVLKGTAIVRIPVTVESIVPYYIPEGSLIMFRASGPDIEQIGAIAEGMSGSPMYVNAQGTDKLVGAVSYGDSFTTGYLGLATPVEYMTAMEDTFLPANGVTPLAKAVNVAGRTIDQVLVAPTQSAGRAAHPAADTAVMVPLASLSIAGLPPHSAAYKDVARRLEAHGVDVAPAGAGIAGQSVQSAVPLDGGSSIAVLLARGAVLYGALGTVTWSDGDRVVAFGHPFMDMGDTKAYVLNAVVHGVWSSSMVPYKVVSPSALRGTLLQDRGTGIVARVGVIPDEVPVTGSVTLQPQGVVGRATSYVPDWVVTSFPGGDGVYLAADAVGAAGYNASDNAMMPGGATTTTTVIVEDAAGHRYTVVRSNTWDDPMDVLGLLSSDAATMLGTLVADPDGVAPATVVSVDMTGQATPTRSSARIVGVRFPGGINPGRRASFQVVLNLYGQSSPLVLDGSLDIPAGASPTGTINVYPAPSSAEGSDSGDGSGSSGTSTDERATVAQRVAAVQALPTNDQLVVEYLPDGATSGTVTPAGLTDLQTSSLDTTLTVAGRYVTGTLQRRTGSVTLKATPRTTSYYGTSTLRGTITETDGATTVDIYAQQYGTAEPKKIATVPAPADGAGGATFTYHATGLKKNTIFTADWAGDTRAIAASASTRVLVSQSVKASAAVTAGSRSVRLSAVVLPGKAGQTVRFERRSGSSWVPVGTAKAVAAPSVGCRATLTWTAPQGTSTVRAVAPATAANAAGTSTPVSVTT
jgi:hypothetical protein